MTRSWRCLLLALTGAALLVGATLAAHAQAPTSPTAMNPWTTLTPFPEPAEELLGATANGKLYIFCGLGPGWTPLAFVYEYDPATNAWTKKKPMALPSHHVRRRPAIPRRFRSPSACELTGGSLNSAKHPNRSLHGVIYTCGR